MSEKKGIKIAETAVRASGYIFVSKEELAELQAEERLKGFKPFLGGKGKLKRPITLEKNGKVCVGEALLN